jgi:hypothetical protein
MADRNTGEPQPESSPEPTPVSATDAEDFWAVVILFMLICTAFSLGYLLGASGTGF